MDDIILCGGFARQKDMNQKVRYDESYFNKCLGYENQQIANEINAGRILFVMRYHDGMVLDIGIGSGEFIKKRGRTHGYDVNPKAVEWLKENGLYSDAFGGYSVFTFWDVLEHIEDHDFYFRHIKKGSYLFTSLPIFMDLNKIRESKHYRPGEHLWYWTEKGFVDWMFEKGFRFLEKRTFEIQAGREDILSFAFIRT